MKLIKGWWLPDYDNTMENVLAPPMFKGRPTYQLYLLINSLRFVRDFRVAVDVGAHVGFLTWPMAHLFDKVVAYEPEMSHFECLRANVPLVNVTAFNTALGEQFLRAQIRRGKGGVSVKAHIAESQIDAPDVPVAPLDEVFPKEDPLDFLKIDCEGYELPVVLGAEAVIRDRQPFIVVEQKVGAKRYGHDRLAAVEKLTSWGMRVMWEWSDDFYLGWYPRKYSYAERGPM